MPEKAIQEYKEALQINPKVAYIHYNLGNAYLKTNAFISLADTYYHLGKIDQSIQEWKTIIDLWPDDHIACYKLAKLLLDACKSDQAIPYLKRCLHLHPDYIDARILLQRIYQEYSLNQVLKTLYG